MLINLVLLRKLIRANVVLPETQASKQAKQTSKQQTTGCGGPGVDPPYRNCCRAPRDPSKQASNNKQSKQATGCRGAGVDPPL